jgi:hypothetical protein
MKGLLSVHVEYCAATSFFKKAILTPSKKGNLAVWIGWIGLAGFEKRYSCSCKL